MESGGDWQPPWADPAPANLQKTDVNGDPQLGKPRNKFEIKVPNINRQIKSNSSKNSKTDWTTILAEEDAHVMRMKNCKTNVPKQPWMTRKSKVGTNALELEPSEISKKDQSTLKEKSILTNDCDRIGHKNKNSLSNFGSKTLLHSGLVKDSQSAIQQNKDNKDQKSNEIEHSIKTSEEKCVLSKNIKDVQMAQLDIDEDESKVNGRIKSTSEEIINEDIKQTFLKLPCSVQTDIVSHQLASANSAQLIKYLGLINQEVGLLNFLFVDIKFLI